MNWSTKTTTSTSLPFLLSIINFCFLILTVFIKHGNSESDLEVLIKLKDSMLESKKGRGLEDWLVNSDHSNNEQAAVHCNFSGVVCDDKFRVVSLNISFVPLFGTLSPEIGMLDKLENLTLVGDNLTGKIPPEISSLTSLTLFNLSNNFFSHSFPGAAVSNLSSLEFIDLYNNNLSGLLPAEIVGLSKLRYLNLGGNYFSGEIPEKYSEIERLEFLRLSMNSLTGKVPGSLSKLQNLRELYLGYSNAYHGGIPPEFGKLSSLQKLDLAQCRLIGGIPKELSNLKNLNTLFLQENNLTGEIPSELSEMVSLKSLDLSFNSFVGEIPETFSNLKNLTLLNFMHNNLVGRIPPWIGDLPHLEVLQVWNNNLTMELPENLGSNGRLKIVDVASNHLTGTIPRDLCKSGLLHMLSLMDNALLGPIPEELGSCHSLQKFLVKQNQLNGTIPSGIFSLPKVQVMQLNDNLFTGTLPIEISGESLGEFDISNSMITGKIPPTIGNWKGLHKLFLQNNQLSGEIPPEIFGLKQLQTLNLNSNTLSGEIPASIGECSSLILVDFSKNNINGEIPASVSNLEVLGSLNLSQNSLTGIIPADIVNITSLLVFDISDNDFYGPIPSGGHFSVFSPAWFGGNPNLCWPHRAQPCPVYNPKQHHRMSLSSSELIILIIALITLFLLSVLTVMILHRKRLKGSKAWKVERFQRLEFKAEDVIDCLKEENIIGKGGAGIVYRGTMPDGTDVAIKRLANRGGPSKNDHGFAAEIATLGQIRHRHIVRLLGYVSNHETNLLVYEFMPNGSLGEKLHGPKGAHLHWEIRYRIAVEAAKGLCYLHHDCSPKIFHRDVKSNNILLDSDYEAHVADFGLAKFLRDTGASECMSSIAGSYGYIAPEYAYTLKVDEKSDVYSFGVVLLELITGRKPVGEFGEGVDIVRWVKKTQSEIYQPSDAATVLAILDSRLNGYQLSSVINMFQVALFCVEEESWRRPTMREVVHRLTNPPPKPIHSIPNLF